MLSVFLKKDILEQVRSRKLLVMVAIFLFLALASPISAKLMPQIVKGVTQQSGIVIKLPEPTYADAIDQFIKNTSQLVILLLVFVVAGAVVDEKIKKTLELVLAKPVSRSIFIFSKFISYFLTITILFLASSLIFYAYTVSIFTTFSITKFLLVAMQALVYILLVTTITICASTIAKSAVLSGIVGLISSVIAGSLLSMIPAVSDYAPGYILSHYKELMQDGWGIQYLPPVLVSLAVIVVLISASVYLFKRQEIER